MTAAKPRWAGPTGGKSLNPSVLFSLVSDRDFFPISSALQIPVIPSSRFEQNVPHQGAYRHSVID